MKRCSVAVLLMLAACQAGIDSSDPTDPDETAVEQDLSVSCPDKPISCSTQGTNIWSYYPGAPMSTATQKQVWVIQTDGYSYYARLADVGSAKIVEAWKAPLSYGPSLYGDLSLKGIMITPRPPVPPPPPIVDWDRIAVEQARFAMKSQDNAQALVSQCGP